jgi:CheY-like chemotaxis protein
MIPLVLLADFTTTFATQALRREVENHVRTTTQVTAAYVDQRIDELISLETSFEQRLEILDALGNGTPSSYNAEAVTATLESLQASHFGIPVAYVTDVSGRVTAEQSANGADTRTMLDSEPWYAGVRATGRPYVSAEYRSGVLSHPLVAAVASYVRDASGDHQPLGILVVEFTTYVIQSQIGGAPHGPGYTISVTDQRGVPVARTDGPVSGSAPSKDPQVIDALSGVSRIAMTKRPDGTEVLAGSGPVKDLGWTVDAQIPMSTAFAGLARLRLVVFVIGGIGYRVDVVPNGADAVEAVKRVPYAAVLMDCQMPVMDGYEATRAIRQEEGQYRHTPIIAMTASALESDQKRSLAAGMDDQICKPVKLDDIGDVLATWIDRSDAPADLGTRSDT